MATLDYSKHRRAAAYRVAAPADNTPPAARHKGPPSALCSAKSIRPTEISTVDDVLQRIDAAGKRTQAIRASASAAPASRGLTKQQRQEADLLLRQQEMHEWLKTRNQHLPRTTLSKLKRQQLQDCFESLDVDRSGMIDVSELKFCVSQLGLDGEVVSELLKQGDDDDDGELSFEEFVSLVAKLGALAAETSTAATANVIVERASSYPLAIVANANHITKLVDGYNPELMDEMTGEYLSKPRRKKKAKWQQAHHGSVATHKLAMLRQQSKRLLAALTGMALPGESADEAVGARRSPSPSKRARSSPEKREGPAEAAAQAATPEWPDAVAPPPKPGLLRRASSKLRQLLQG